MGATRHQEDKTPGGHTLCDSTAGPGSAGIIEKRVPQAGLAKLSTPRGLVDPTSGGGEARRPEPVIA